MMRKIFLTGCLALSAAGQGIYPSEPKDFNIVCKDGEADANGVINEIMPSEVTLNGQATADSGTYSGGALTNDPTLLISATVGDQPVICGLDGNKHIWQASVRFGLPDAESGSTDNGLSLNEDYHHFGTRLTTDSDVHCSTSGSSNGNAADINRMGTYDIDRALSATGSSGSGQDSYGSLAISTNLAAMVANCGAPRWSTSGDLATAPVLYYPFGNSQFGAQNTGCETYRVPISILWEAPIRADQQDRAKIVVSHIIYEVTFCPVYEQTFCVTWLPEMELVYPVFAEVDSVMPVHQGTVADPKLYNVRYAFEVRVENPGPDGDVVRARGLQLTHHCAGYQATDDPTDGSTSSTGTTAASLEHLDPIWMGSSTPSSLGDSNSYAQQTRFGFKTAAKDFGTYDPAYFARCNWGGNDGISIDGTEDYATADMCFQFGLESCDWDYTNVIADGSANACFPIDLPAPLEFCYQLPVTIFYKDEDSEITFEYDQNKPTMLVWEEQGHKLNSLNDAYDNTVSFAQMSDNTIGASNGVYNPLWLDSNVKLELAKRGILQRRNQLSLASYFAPFSQAVHSASSSVYSGDLGDHSDASSHNAWETVDIDMYIMEGHLQLTSICSDNVPAHRGSQTINMPVSSGLPISTTNLDRLYAVYSTEKSRDYGVPPEADPSSEDAAWFAHYPKRYCRTGGVQQGRDSADGSYATDTASCKPFPVTKLPMITSYEAGNYDGYRRDNVDGFSLNTYWTLEALFNDQGYGTDNGELHVKNPLCNKVSGLTITGDLRVNHWGNYLDSVPPNSQAAPPRRRVLLSSKKSSMKISENVEDAILEISSKQRRLLQQGNQGVGAQSRTQQEVSIAVGEEESAQPPSMIGPIVPIAAGGAVSLCCCFFLIAARRRSKKNQVKAFNKYKGEAFSAKVVDSAVVNVEAQQDVASVA